MRLKKKHKLAAAVVVLFLWSSNFLAPKLTVWKPSFTFLRKITKVKIQQLQEIYKFHPIKKIFSWLKKSQKLLCLLFDMAIKVYTLKRIILILRIAVNMLLDLELWLKLSEVSWCSQYI